MNKRLLATVTITVSLVEVKPGIDPDPIPSNLDCSGFSRDYFTWSMEMDHLDRAFQSLQKKLAEVRGQKERVGTIEE